MEVDAKTVTEVKRTYNAIKSLEEEKKSITEDIKEEKSQCAKNTGMDNKDVTAVIKILRMREKGFNSEQYDELVKAVEESS